MDGYNVTLLGQVSRPALEDDAARVVKSIEGVERIDNKIEVLPLSPDDDGILQSVCRPIYRTPALNRYAHAASRRKSRPVALGRVQRNQQPRDRELFGRGGDPERRGDNGMKDESFAQ